MLLEQNLFSIYRLILKIPRPLYLAALALTLFIIVTQVIYITTLPQRIDFSQLLLDYVIKKHEQRIINSTSNPDNTNVTQIESDLSQEYALLDAGTFLDFRVGEDGGQVTLNYSRGNTRPHMFVIRNQFLVYLKPKPQDYLSRHGITYDLITLPPISFDEPFCSFYFDRELQMSEILQASFRTSYVQFLRRFGQYRKQENMTGEYKQMEEMYINFYYMDDGYRRIFTNNFFRDLGFHSLTLFTTIIFKFSCTIQILIVLMLSSTFMGLLIRCGLNVLQTIFLVVCNPCLPRNASGVGQYCNILSGRGTGRVKMMVMYVLASIGGPLLLTLGSYCILAKLLLPFLPLLIEEYSKFFLKVLFVIEVFHYLMSRSRTMTKFFPLLSFMSSFTIMFVSIFTRSPILLMLLNIHLTFHILLFLVFILIEQAIIRQGSLSSEFKPSKSRPRMLFYAGFDISWEKQMAPIWTYFSTWFDYSYFSAQERCYIEKDYQLLYGRMLGLNERQEIPEDDYQLQEIPNEPSNEMHLIQE